MLLDVREVTPSRGLATVRLTLLTVVLAREEATLPATEPRSPIESLVLCRFSPAAEARPPDMEVFMLDDGLRIWLAGERDTLWMGAKSP